MNYQNAPTEQAGRIRRFYGTCLSVFVLLSLLNGYAVWLGAKNIRQYKGIVDRISEITDIKNQLAGIDAEVWGIVSGYDPKSSTAIGFKDAKFNGSLKKIGDLLDSKLDADWPEGIKLKLYAVEKSFKSILRNISALEDTEKSRILDEESTSIFFPGSTKATMLSESYVDSSVKRMENLRISIKVVNRNIDDYALAEMAELSRLNQSMEKHYKKWIVIDISAFLAILALAFARLTIRKAVPASS